MLLIHLVVLFFNALKVNALECVSVINQKCMSRPKIIETNPDEPVFFPYSIKINKCSGSCNNPKDLFARLCVPDVVKNINAKVYNLITRINETKNIVWHETCKCICRLSKEICNSRQVFNEGKCRCECREDFISKLTCDKGFLWNPSSCSCECDRSCRIEQYLDYKNCVCINKLPIIDNVVEECINIVDGETFYEKALDDWSSCALYVRFLVSFLVTTVISGIFIHFYWCKKKNSDADKVNYSSIGKINY